MVSSAEKSHMRWLVKGRSRNQECCLRLLELPEKNIALCKKENDYFFGFQDLTGAAFSLWRAVFLGEKEGKNPRSLNIQSSFFGASFWTMQFRTFKTKRVTSGLSTITSKTPVVG